MNLNFGANWTTVGGSTGTCLILFRISMDLLLQGALLHGFEQTKGGFLGFPHMRIHWWPQNHERGTVSAQVPCALMAK